MGLSHFFFVLGVLLHPWNDGAGWQREFQGNQTKGKTGITPAESGRDSSRSEVSLGILERKTRLVPMETPSRDFTLRVHEIKVGIP